MSGKVHDGFKEKPQMNPRCVQSVKKIFKIKCTLLIPWVNC